MKCHNTTCHIDINLVILCFCLQDKKRIARKKADAKKAALLEAGIDVRDQANILDEEDNDLLF